MAGSVDRVFDGSRNRESTGTGRWSGFAIRSGTMRMPDGSVVDQHSGIMGGEITVVGHRRRFIHRGAYGSRMTSRTDSLASSNVFDHSVG